MNRFHVHIAVAELDASVRFYSSLFGAAPSVLKADYAKWMIEDPRVNFAISTRGQTPGLNHLGFQVDSSDELGSLRERVASADLAVVDEPGAACCYAKSDKHWLQDPQGIAWETFHSLGSIPVFGAPAHASEAACCTPEAAALPAAARKGCGSSDASAAEPRATSACCG